MCDGGAVRSPDPRPPRAGNQRPTDLRLLEIPTRPIGCVAGLVALSLAGSGGVLLLLVLAASWGGGSGAFLAVHLGLGLTIGFAGLVLGLVAAEALLSRRLTVRTPETRPASPQSEREPVAS